MNYFGEREEKAIIDYNNETCYEKKNKIFNEIIHPAFQKLVEGIIHRWKFYYFEVDSKMVNHEVCSFLVTKMHKYDNTKGRAFSYFGTIAKNYLILNNNKNFSDWKKIKSYDCLDDMQKEQALYREHRNTDFVKDEKTTLSIHYNNIISKLIEKLKVEKDTICKREKDVKILDGILYILSNKDNLLDYNNVNKNIVYVLLKEYSRESSASIANMLKKVKLKYDRVSKEYWKEMQHF